MISPAKIDEVLQAARIEEVIGEFVNLKKSGRSYKGLSPFVNEKTPSFMVSPEKQIFKDFSSGKGGNVLSFIMEHEHFTYPEAIKWLAKKYNIEVEEQQTSPEQKEAESERESLFIVTRYAEEYFSDQLNNTDEGKSIGLSYFKERGFHQETIEKFKLGYSPNEWSHFLDSATAKGYKSEFLLKAGLVKESSKGQDRLYDGYKGRVIFPIHNLSGRPIGFGGRTLLTDKKVPKYINSPESLIYNKSAVLYGLYFAKGEIIKNDNCFLVEGYTDVISFYQAGVKNVVASSGTALTIEQIRLIKRYTSNVTVLYDGDSAGIKASFRGIDMILEEGLNVKMISFPEGEDPDSFARKNDLADITDFITNNAFDFIVSKTKILLGDAGNDPIKKATLVKDIVSSIALIPEAISRSVYVKECSSLLDIEEKILINELNKIRRNRHLQNEKQRSRDNIDQSYNDHQEQSIDEFRSEPRVEENVITSQEHDILRIILNYADKKIQLDGEEGDKIEVEIAPFMVNELVKDEMEFQSPVERRFLDLILERTGQGKLIDSNFFINHEEKEISSLAVDLLTSKHELHDWWNKRQILVEGEDTKLKRAVEGALYSYKSKRITLQIAENQEKMKEAQEGGDFDKVVELLKTQQMLDHIKSSLAKPNGRIILN